MMLLNSYILTLSFASLFLGLTAATTVTYFIAEGQFDGGGNVTQVALPNGECTQPTQIDPTIVASYMVTALDEGCHGTTDHCAELSASQDVLLTISSTHLRR